MPQNRKNSSLLVQVVAISLSKEVHTPEAALRRYEDLVFFSSIEVRQLTILYQIATKLICEIGHISILWAGMTVAK
jgi:hypothetical protein